MAQKKIWTDEETNRLTLIYKLYDDKELAVMFNTSAKAVYAKKIHLKLHIPQKRVELPEGYSKCSICEQILLSEGNFYRDKSTKSGFSHRCKECEKGYAKQRKALRKMAEKDNDKEKKIQKYIKENKGIIFFCKKCNSEKTIEDYYVYAHKDGHTMKSCKGCIKRRDEERITRDFQTKGYK